MACLLQSNRAVFLDRDGVIIEEKVFIHNPEDVILINGAAEAIKRLSSMRLRVIVVTNQSGIGRGLFLKEDYQKVEERIDSLLRRSGASIDVSYYCPHAPREDCNCRKPRPGMAFQAVRDLNVDLSGSFVVGDKRSDMEFARAIGAKGILVRTGYGRNTELEGKPVWDVVADSIEDAVGFIGKWIGEEDNGK